MIIINELLNKKIKNIHLNELFKGSFVSLIIRILAVLTSYIFSLLIAKLYGASALGSFVLAQTMLLMVTIIAKLGFDTLSVKYISKNYKENNIQKIRSIYTVILKLVVVWSIILSILLFFLSDYIAVLIGKPEMKKLYQIASIGILPFSLLLIHSESFRGLKNIIYYSIFRNMSTPFIASIILLLFYYFNMNTFEYPLYSYILSIIILSVISFILWNKKIPYPTNKNKDIKIKPLLFESLPMMLTSSMSYILNWTSILILAYYRPEWEIGVYNIAMKVSLLTGISLFAINSIAAPKFAEMYRKESMEEFKNIITQSTRLIFLSSFPFLLLFLIFPNFFLSLFGDEFIYGKWALIFLTIGQFINAISGSVGYILQMTGNQKIFQYIMISSTIINIILNLILVPKYGINGAAISSLISVSFWNITSIIIIKIKYNILTIYLPRLLK